MSNELHLLHLELLLVLPLPPGLLLLVDALLLLLVLGDLLVPLLLELVGVG